MAPEGSGKAMFPVWEKRAMPFEEETPRYQGRDISVLYDKFRRSSKPPPAGGVGPLRVRIEPADEIAERLKEMNAPERRAEARACWEAWCRAKVESERALAAAGGGGAAAPESEDLRKTVPRQRAGVVMTSFEHEAWVQSKREGRLAAERARTEADEWLAGQQAAYLQQRLEGHEARLAAVAAARAVKRAEVRPTAAKRAAKLQGLKRQLVQLRGLDVSPLLVGAPKSHQSAASSTPNTGRSATARGSKRGTPQASTLNSLRGASASSSSLEGGAKDSMLLASWRDEAAETLAGGVPSGANLLRGRCAPHLSGGASLGLDVGSDLRQPCQCVVERPN